MSLIVFWCQELNNYDPVREFLFVRLYLSTGQSGDGTLMWDAVAYEVRKSAHTHERNSSVSFQGEPSQELVKKFAAPPSLSVEEVDEKVQ